MHSSRFVDQTSYPQQNSPIICQNAHTHSKFGRDVYSPRSSGSRSDFVKRLKHNYTSKHE